MSAPEAGSTRCTPPPLGSRIQSAPSPAATKRGEPPIRVVPTTEFVAGSIRKSWPPKGLVTHTAPPAIATPAPGAGRAIRAVGEPLAASKRVRTLSGFSPAVTAQTEPSPAAMLPCQSNIFAGIVRVTAFEVGSTR